jgi:hypothetical protein
MGSFAQRLRARSDTHGIGPVRTMRANHETKSIRLALVAAVMGCGNTTATPDADTGASTSTGAPGTSDLDASSSTTTGLEPTSTGPTVESESGSSGADTTTASTSSTSGDTGDLGSSTSGALEDGSSSTGVPSFGEPVVLSVAPVPCELDTTTFPLVAYEIGHHAATVLTPTEYPTQITTVVYQLNDEGGPCDNTVAHAVEVFVIDREAPPANPSQQPVFQAIPIPPAPGTHGLRIVEVELEPAIVLEEGQSIVVAVVIGADDEQTHVTCISSCLNGGVEGADFWGSAVSEPIPWSDLVAESGFGTNFNTRALGFGPAGS